MIIILLRLRSHDDEKSLAKVTGRDPLRRPANVLRLFVVLFVPLQTLPTRARARAGRSIPSLAFRHNILYDYEKRLNSIRYNNISNILQWIIIFIITP